MKKEILKNKILRENYESFRRLVEYTNAGPSGIMSEDGEENQPNMEGPNQAMGAQQGGPDMSSADPSMGGEMGQGMDGGDMFGEGPSMAGGQGGPEMGRNRRYLK